MSSTVTPQTMANAIRALSMDAVQKAKSGHPGMPMGMADIATALWSRHLRYNPVDPKWSAATASFSRTVTVRCCSTLCCT